MSLTTLNGHSMAWQTLSVQDFFGQIPWTGAPVVLPAPGGHDASQGGGGATLSLQLKVGEFFSHFPWDGKPSIAAPLPALDIQPNLPVDDSMTLDGFADLF